MANVANEGGGGDAPSNDDALRSEWDDPALLAKARAIIKTFVKVLMTLDAMTCARILARAPPPGRGGDGAFHGRVAARAVAEDIEALGEAARELAGLRLRAELDGTAEEAAAIDDAARDIQRSAAHSLRLIMPPDPGEAPRPRDPGAATGHAERARGYADRVRAIAAEVAELAELGLSPDEERSLCDGLERIAEAADVLLMKRGEGPIRRAPSRAVWLARSVGRMVRAALLAAAGEGDDDAGATSATSAGSAADRWEELLGLAQALDAESERRPEHAATLRAVSKLAVFVEAASLFGHGPCEHADSFPAAAGVFLDDIVREPRGTRAEVVDLALQCLGHDPGRIKATLRKREQLKRDREEPWRPRWRAEARAKRKG